MYFETYLHCNIGIRQSKISVDGMRIELETFPISLEQFDVNIQSALYERARFFVNMAEELAEIAFPNEQRAIYKPSRESIYFVNSKGIKLSKSVKESALSSVPQAALYGAITLALGDRSIYDNLKINVEVPQSNATAFLRFYKGYAILEGIVL